MNRVFLSQINKQLAWLAPPTGVVNLAPPVGVVHLAPAADVGLSGSQVCKN